MEGPLVVCASSGGQYERHAQPSVQDTVRTGRRIFGLLTDALREHVQMSIRFGMRRTVPNLESGAADIPTAISEETSVARTPILPPGVRIPGGVTEDGSTRLSWLTVLTLACLLAALFSDQRGCRLTTADG
jgi:hypothetical protein